MQMDYRVLFVSDANATYSDAAHGATLDNMAGSFAEPPTTNEVIAAVTRHAHPKTAVNKQDSSSEQTRQQWTKEADR